MDGKPTTLPGRALNGDLAAVGLGDVLDNREAQPGAPQFPAAGLVDAIKSFKKPGEVFFSDADTLVFDNNIYFRIV